MWIVVRHSTPTPVCVRGYNAKTCNAGCESYMTMGKHLVLLSDVSMPCRLRASGTENTNTRHAGLVERRCTSLNHNAPGLKPSLHDMVTEWLRRLWYHLQKPYSDQKNVHLGNAKVRRGAQARRLTSTIFVLVDTSNLLIDSQIPRHYLRHRRINGEHKRTTSR